MRFFLSRLTEASSWSAIAGVAALVVHSIPVPQVQAIATVVGVVGGLVGVLKPEAGNTISAIAKAAAEGVAKK
jgi:hypothetical protein